MRSLLDEYFRGMAVGLHFIRPCLVQGLVALWLRQLEAWEHPLSPRDTHKHAVTWPLYVGHETCVARRQGIRLGDSDYGCKLFVVNKGVCSFRRGSSPLNCVPKRNGGGRLQPRSESAPSQGCPPREHLMGAASQGIGARQSLTFRKRKPGWHRRARHSKHSSLGTSNSPELLTQRPPHSAE